ncbi:acyl-CoA dehydrogenase family protein [Streptomyces sp. NPDC047725]|uniref:acyl-CoA dehydrogenase family protein n=1 Tax=Streptomyces sp. NPDC047725 TaxID=3365487 RepID=UPI0037103382
MDTLHREERLDATAAHHRSLATEHLTGAPEGDFRARWQRLAGSGLLRTARQWQHRDRELDPGEGSVSHAVAAIEGIGLAGTEPGLCYAFASQLFGIQLPLSHLLSEAQHTMLSGVEDGTALLCHASTETGGGSDPLSGDVRAERRPDGSYRLHGTKSFITAAPVADVGLVFARTGEGRSPFALSAFLVDLTDGTVTRGERVTKTALKDAPMGSLTFTGTVVPPGSLVGAEGAGLSVLGTTTTWERALLLAYALGPMRLLLDRVVEWAGKRHHFGRPMGSSHQVAARVSDMALRLERSRTMVRAMAARLDAGVPVRRLSSAAALTKISVSEDYVALTRHATALAGVRAFVEDSGLTASLADPMAALTYAGPNDLLSVAVARDLGLPVEN